MPHPPPKVSDRPARANRIVANAIHVAATTCLVLHAEAQTANVGRQSFVHQSWSVQDGLPVNSINSIVQSRDGYLWLATFDGLVRFDGVRFTVFNTTNSESLPSNRIVHLYESRDSSLWLRTEQSQLVRFRHGSFTLFDAQHGLGARAISWYEDARGRMWIGTDRGLGRIEGDRLVSIALGGERDSVLAITGRSNGVVWAGTAGGGLYRIDTKVTRLDTPPWPRNSTSGRVSALLSVGDTALYVVQRGVAWRYGESRPRGFVGHVFMMRAAPRTGVPWTIGDTLVSRIDRDHAVNVTKRVDPPFTLDGFVNDAEGRMSFGGGAELYRDGESIASLLPRGEQNRISVLTITSLILDREGSYWLGTKGAGLHRLKPSTFTVFSEAEGLSHRNVNAVYEDRNGVVWVGTVGSNRIIGGAVSRVPPTANHPYSAISFTEDRAGRLWVGGGFSAGLRVCAPGGLTCKSLPGDPIGRARVMAIQEDASGSMWIGSDPGLFRYDSTGWHRFTASVDAPAFPVRAFRRTRDGALWMATAGGGISRYKNGTFRHVGTRDGLPHNSVRALYEDADGWLWVGTEGHGLARIDPREWAPGTRGRIVSYRATHGLFDEVIHEVLEDNFGRLWMGTNRGIFWVMRDELLAFADARTTRIHSTVYSETDGLRNREANGGSQSAGAKSRDGRLWFATQDGVAMVDPARIQRNPLPPNVVIENVITNGTVVAREGSRVHLTTQQRDLEIQFTALSFLAPANMRFRYRLEPYDPGWVDAGNRRSAFYTKVPPGRYTFRVQASNNDGIWNERGAALAMDLAPHVWERRSFRMFALVTLVLAVSGVIQLRLRALRNRSRELAQLVDERTNELHAQRQQLARQAGALQELDRVKSRFFANVSHEFRTPLTLTIGPLDDLRDKMRTSGLTPPRQVDMALRNARRLLRLVNQVLDVAKLEAGRMTLHAEPQDIVALVRGISAAFEPVAEQKRIQLKVASRNAALIAMVDSDAFEKILANLLSNAFKFTPAGGRIDVDVDAAGDGEASFARIRVADSGPGIPSEHIPHVFERFYQVDESTTRAEPGTGIGLSLARELVELHGGRIAVEGSCAGATFVVQFPLTATTRDHDAVDSPKVISIDEIDLNASRSHEHRERTPVHRTDDVTTILVVDDNGDFRRYVADHFADRYRVVEASNGAEGIAEARDTLPDLVISDVMMPVTDGNALCRALKGSQDTDFIPIILLTARSGTEEVVIGLEAGADDYVVKPFEMRELDARVEALLLSRRRLRERFGREAPALREDRPHASTNGDQAFVERFWDAVDTQLGNPEFGVGELADALFLDRTHLFRRSRDLLGEAPSDLIRRRRLERGATLLATGADGVAEIAYAVGFNSVSYFSRAFRQAYGVTPTEFRKADSLQPG